MQNIREHTIEYANHDLLTKMGVFVGGCCLVAVAIMTLASNEVALTSGFVTGIALPLGYLLANPSKIRKTGIILISYDRIIFGMGGRVKVVDLFELAQYHIAYHDGTILTLILKNGDKFRIMANNNFCDTSKLEHACHDIEMAIHQIRGNEGGENVGMNNIKNNTNYELLSTNGVTQGTTPADN